MKYLVTAPVQAYAIDPRRGAMDRAFCEHLRELLTLLHPDFDEMTVATEGMSRRDFDANRSALGVLDAGRDRIRVVPLYDADLSAVELTRRLPSILSRLGRLVRDHDLVQSTPSRDLRRPVTSAALTMAVRRGIPTISVTEADDLSDAVMNLRLGHWPLWSCLLCRHVTDPMRELQQRWLARRCSLVLFQLEAQRAQYGEGRPNVKLMREPRFQARHVIGDAELEQKVAGLRDPRRPLEAVYFGRLVYREGVDRCVEAVARAQALGRNDVRLTIMGAGEEKGALERLVATRGLEDRVVFREPVAHDDGSFAALRPYHLLLAAPLGNQTSRSAWDAIASGMGVVAFGTAFYRDLAAATGAVATVRWGSARALGDALAELAIDRGRVEPLIRAAARTARVNTSADWLRRRVTWTRALFSRSPVSAGGRGS